MGGLSSRSNLGCLSGCSVLSGSEWYGILGGLRDLGGLDGMGDQGVWTGLSCFGDLGYLDSQGALLYE